MRSDQRLHAADLLTASERSREGAALAFRHRTYRPRDETKDHEKDRLFYFRFAGERFVMLGRIGIMSRWVVAAFLLCAGLSSPVHAERRVLNAGDAYYFESRRPHRFRCIGAKPCEVISACTPPTF